MNNKLNLTIITGLSGAGKTVAIQSFEDMGYFTIDNMPPNLIDKFVALLTGVGEDGVVRFSSPAPRLNEGSGLESAAGGLPSADAEEDKPVAPSRPSIDKLALVVDMRSREFFDDLQGIVTELVDNKAIAFKLLFLDATDGELVSRYKETRRSHPLAADGRTLDGIVKERKLLEPFRALASSIIDTSNLTPRQLRGQIQQAFSSKDATTFRVEVLSFGFKYGLPLDADLVFDVRFLPNPYYLPELRNMSGQDKPVYDYVMDNAAAESFNTHLMNLLLPILPAYQSEGKSVLTVAFGCTGGQHRSVAFAERVGKALSPDWHVNISHRDKDKRKETVNRS